MRRILFFLFFTLFVLPAYTQSHEHYEETWLSGKKVINGLTRQQALDEFGEPSRTDSDFWFYSAEEPFYVYFSDDEEISFFIFPFNCQAKLGTPFQLKAFIGYPEFKIEEVTPYVNWITTSSKLLYLKGNYFLPLEEGSGQVIAEYKNKMSNACNVDVRFETDKLDEEELLSLHVFPHKPVVVMDDVPTFLAFGVFRDRKEKRVFAKDISSNVRWFASHGGGQASPVYDNTISFPTPGESRVFCRYQDLKSNAQEVEVRGEYFFKGDTIKYMHLVPDIAIADIGSEVEFKAVATTFSNRAFDIAKDLYWDTDDKSVASFKQKGVLKLIEKGVVSVEARGKGHTSYPAKVVIKERDSVLKKETRGELSQEETSEKSVDERLQKIQQSPAELASLRLSPEFLEIAVGETSDLEAEAVYSDHTSEDVTSLVEWEVSVPDKIFIEEGELKGLDKGETEVHAYFENIKSNRCLIRIKGPKLISIVLEPKSVKKELGQKFKIEATGYYGDDSRKDITDSSNWDIGNDRIISNLGKGLFGARRLGETSISASIGSVKSLPAQARVFISPFSIFKFISLILLVIFILLFLMFLMLIKRKRSELKKFLISNPSQSMIDIFQHSRRVFQSCGIPYKSNTPPLRYGQMIEEKFSLGKGTFSALAAKFCEAKYSSHKISPQEAQQFLEKYNGIMQLVRQRYHDKIMLSVSLFIRRQPLTI